MTKEMNDQSQKTELVEKIAEEICSVLYDMDHRWPPAHQLDCGHDAECFREAARRAIAVMEREK